MSDNTLQGLSSLKGKIALVTGGSQNFGLEISTGMIEAGATLIITSRDAAKAEAKAAELSAEHGAEVCGMGMDLLDEASIIKLFEDVKDRFGRCDVLVNNAGGHSSEATGKLETEPLEAWCAFIDTNMTGTFLMTREYAKLMMSQGSGSIINIASIAASVGRDRRVYPDGMKPQPVQYAAAKAGMLGLTYDSAAYLSDSGIRVNAISPGGFERGQPDAFVEGYSDRAMLKRMGRDGRDLKGSVCFLASDAAGYITGHNLIVDGGFSRFK
jgi:NAD(P)-dependent dehydrogenase (short-subunit alcohol dehydrogenase family)